MRTTQHCFCVLPYKPTIRGTASNSGICSPIRVCVRVTLYMGTLIYFALYVHACIYCTILTSEFWWNCIRECIIVEFCLCVLCMCTYCTYMYVMCVVHVHVHVHVCVCVCVLGVGLGVQE